MAWRHGRLRIPISTGSARRKSPRKAIRQSPRQSPVPPPPQARHSRGLYMNRRHAIMSVLVCLTVSSLAHAQDPVGAIEGLITEKSGSPVAARVAAKNLDNGFTKQVST